MSVETFDPAEWLEMVMAAPPHIGRAAYRKVATRISATVTAENQTFAVRDLGFGRKTAGLYSALRTLQSGAALYHLRDSGKWVAGYSIDVKAVTLKCRHCNDRMLRKEFRFDPLKIALNRAEGNPWEVCFECAPSSNRLRPDKEEGKILCEACETAIGAGHECWINQRVVCLDCLLTIWPKARDPLYGTAVSLDFSPLADWLSEVVQP